MKKPLAALAAAIMLAACAPQGQNTAAPQAASAAAQSTAERNKANVLDFYELAFNQHNPQVGDGGQAFIDAFAPFLKENPQSRAEVKRVAADGDLVWVHVHSQNGEQDRGEAVVDIFRLDENGKIVEHWDVIQAVPEKTASGRSMF